MGHIVVDGIEGMFTMCASERVCMFLAHFMRRVMDFDVVNTSARHVW